MRLEKRNIIWGSRRFKKPSSPLDKFSPRRYELKRGKIWLVYFSPLLPWSNYSPCISCQHLKKWKKKQPKKYVITSKIVWQECGHIGREREKEKYTYEYEYWQHFFKGRTCLAVSTSLSLIFANLCRPHTLLQKYIVFSCMWQPFTIATCLKTIHVQYCTVSTVPIEQTNVNFESLCMIH